ADDPMNSVRAMLAAAVLGIPQKEFDLKYVDPETLDAVEKHQKSVMIKYLMARNAAGAEITVPTRILSSFSRNVEDLGFQVNIVDGQDPARHETLVSIKAEPRSAS